MLNDGVKFYSSIALQHAGSLHFGRVEKRDNAFTFRKSGDKAESVDFLCGIKVNVLVFFGK